MGKTNWEMKSLFALQVRTSRRRRLQMQLALNNRRRFLNLVYLLLLLIPKETSQNLVQFVLVVGFFKIIIFFYFLSTTCMVVYHRSACFPTRHTLIVFTYVYRSGFCTSNKYISFSRSKTKTYLPAFPAILFYKIKTSCVHRTKTRPL